ncbi:MULTISPECIES: 50S ribosomal protein L23 [unclassified Oleiphilus]|jgi:large subunit ribosomal protein L23|uniref:50S ribosomal protein L23 n=1 Tax=unclassified Oleiphilus TaxID=2631174 RepID=UPI0007C2510A|nr:MULTISPECIES: 50S ribosomal protein L23 [unclassified Oleiphilus]KZY43868.1 50S ribosomal protein L23 [Oleiphilus sp. HI0050]KZY73820.1 50S ribosomal protein L23 [Oleiphilus sp. HI0068]KZY85549.1 50S ribosomal protein L23 [Oleiphilus sp. HI0069]KZY92259.1 50S ribosomal protein L23 [Oleiphilus sp. HI0072]KZZ12384.1 50S ribosomal protein L23 [Oleiphilus sp. HI0078]KZZ20927.1 50S ribosomal protein L23 [Oleiphilus sp. HI0081]KZZ45366.1 50S ribosomal protein L23 [Oleiphilus sp. HI0085]
MNEQRIYKVLLGPHISEKASMAAENNQVCFKVAADASKPEIKKAVEKLFNVTVEAVQTVNIKGKTKFTKNGLGKRKDIRKAYVKLAEGQDIDFMDVE